MYFVIYFDIASLIILLFLVGGIIYKKQYDARANKYYLATIVVTFFAGLFDILGSLTESPIRLLMLTNSLYFLSRSSITLLFILYVISSANLWSRFRKNALTQIITYLPIITVTIVLMVNLFTQCVFYFDADKGYHRNFLIYLVYCCNYAYGIGVIILLLFTRRTSSFFKLFALISAAVIQAAASITQFFSGNLLLEIFSCTCSLLILQTFVEGSEDYIEYQTRIYNSNAFNRYVRDKIEMKREFNVILVHLDNMPRLFSVYKRRKALTILREVSLKLTNKPRSIDITSHTYYIEQSTFAVVQNDTSKTAKITKFLENYLTSTIHNQDDVNFIFQPKICVVNYPLDFVDNNSLFNFASSFYNIIDFKGTVLEMKDYQLKNEVNLLLALDRILDRAIKEKSFEMYYQPIYSVKEKRFTCAESLIRLVDPTYGFVPPAVFIPYAEKTGKMYEIGNIILEKSFEFIASEDFKSQNIDYIEINLSILQLLDIDLISRINSLVEKYQIKKESINFELTETVAIAGDQVVENNIFSLSKEGYKLSLDDFGVGYSNFARLFLLPFNVIKADKMIIERLNDEDSGGIFKNIIHIIAESNFKLVAEGVDTKEKLEKISSLDFDYIQGYYLSQPLPKKAFIEFLKEHN